MAKLKRLKWVPMLIKAYYDAQNRLEARPRMATGLNESPVRAEGAPAAPPAPATSPQRVAKRRIKKHKPVSKRLAPSSVDKNARLLRELRVTNRRLASLESIQKQLQQMEATIDGFNQQISQLKQEKQSLEKEQASFTETTSPTQSSANAQIPPYPF